MLRRRCLSLWLSLYLWSMGQGRRLLLHGRRGIMMRLMGVLRLLLLLLLLNRLLGRRAI